MHSQITFGLHFVFLRYLQATVKSMTLGLRGKKYQGRDFFFRKIVTLLEGTWKIDACIAKPPLQ